MMRDRVRGLLAGIGLMLLTAVAASMAMGPCLGLVFVMVKIARPSEWFEAIPIFILGFVAGATLWAVLFACAFRIQSELRGKGA